MRKGKNWRQAEPDLLMQGASRRCGEKLGFSEGTLKSFIRADAIA